MQRTRRERHWSIGVDLGGTWVRVAARDDAGRRRVFTARSPGLAGLPAFLAGRLKRWGVDPSSVRGLVVASRGVWTPAERRRHGRRLAGLAVAIRVISDAEAAYHAALGDRPGILLLAGTGSVALGRDARGHFARAGGLGPLLGDEGSAFWIGREWLRTSDRRADFATARRVLASADPVARIAALSPAVLRRAAAGSPRARQVVARGQRALADLLASAARALGARPPIAVSWGGSLLGNRHYRNGVWRAARDIGLDVEAVTPTTTATQAALSLAVRLSEGRPRR